jgi:hypothetical protein
LITCASDTKTSCQAAASDSVESRGPTGRRIYIHESSLQALALRGTEEARLVYRMAARTVVVKAVHHLEQDSALLGLSLDERAQELKQTINLAWADNTTMALRSLGYRPADPRARTHIERLLGNEEKIFASCYFSNYFTYATGAQTAGLMFADTNDIATLRQRMQSGAEYGDLLLVNGNCLVLIDPEAGFGIDKALCYFNRSPKASHLTDKALAQVRKEVYAETRSHLDEMIRLSMGSEQMRLSNVGAELIGALDYAFTKGILKSTSAEFANSCLT